MTDVQPTGAGSDPARMPDLGSATDTAFALVASYAPGSRLRRALDIARQAGASSAPAAPTEQPLEDAGASTITEHRSGKTAEQPPAASPTAADASPSLPAETWETAVQGWVQLADGSLEWRPIVSTVDQLDQWVVGTYLGIASGQADAGSDSGVQGVDPGSGSLANARSLAVARLVDDAVRRGAHGVLGVALTVTHVAGRTVATAVGTAVTLTHRHAERAD